MKRPENILIVGAGLIGSLLAVLLGRRGYRVSMIEKRSDMRNHQVSAGRSINLALAERGIYPLKLAGLFDEVEKLLIPMRGRLIHEPDGSTDFLPYGQRPDEYINSVSRGELNRLMMTSAETHSQVEIIFDKECKSIDLDECVAEVLCHKTGNTEQVVFDLVIGADGAASVVREAILASTGGHCTVDMLDHDYKELEIPAGPNGEFQLEKERLHIWPRRGYMLIALPNLDGSFTVTLFLPKKGNPSFELIDEPAELAQFFSEQFKSAMDLIPDLQADYFGNPQGELGTVRSDVWSYQDRALVLGDAAHAIVPFHGQGMNAGFEDCAELIRMLEENNEDWDLVMSQFAAERIPNANAIADMALENYITMRDSVLDEEFQLKKEIGFELERQFPDRFIPRYSMVMFHRMPYSVAQQRGVIQEEILTQLIAESPSESDFDRQVAASLIEKRLMPI